MNNSGKKLSTPIVIGIILCVISLVLLAGGTVMYFAANNNESKAESSSDPAKNADGIDSTAQTDIAGEVGSDPLIPYTEPAFYPYEMESMLNESGIGAADFNNKRSNQLVAVRINGSNAEISFFENNGGVWEEDKSLACKGNACDGETDATPKGLYAIGEAFYQNIVPETGLARFHVTDGTYWIDDPESDDYNKRVELSSGSAKAVKMGGVSDYKYGFVIGYNAERDPEKGSAVFFHTGSEPTHGSISAPESNVLNILKHLDSKQNPYILVI